MNTLNLNDPVLTVLRVITPIVCIVWVAFVARYSVRTWWRSLEGQHLMAMALLLSVTFFLATLLPWLNLSTRAKLVISVVVYALIGGVGLHRHWLLTRADREARRDVDGDDHQDTPR